MFAYILQVRLLQTLFEAAQSLSLHQRENGKLPPDLRNSGSTATHSFAATNERATGPPTREQNVLQRHPRVTRSTPTNILPTATQECHPGVEARCHPEPIMYKRHWTYTWQASKLIEGDLRSTSLVANS